MNYILILGNSYRDCKEKLGSITKKDGVKYTFVTKTKHLRNIPFSNYIETNKFYNNPQKKEILNIVKDKLNIGDAEYIEMDVSFDNPSLEEKNDNSELESNIENESEEDQNELESNIENKLDEDNIKTLDELEEYIDNNYNQEEIQEETENEIQETVEEDENINEDDDVKPTGNPPRGWHARKEYIDDDGNIFEKGKYIGNINEK